MNTYYQKCLEKIELLKEYASKYEEYIGKTKFEINYKESENSKRCSYNVIFDSNFVKGQTKYINRRTFESKRIIDQIGLQYKNLNEEKIKRKIPNSKIKDVELNIDDSIKNLYEYFPDKTKELIQSIEKFNKKAKQKKSKICHIEVAELKENAISESKFYLIRGDGKVNKSMQYGNLKTLIRRELNDVSTNNINVKVIGNYNNIHTNNNTNEIIINKNNVETNASESKSIFYICFFTSKDKKISFLKFGYSSKKEGIRIAQIQKNFDKFLCFSAIEFYIEKAREVETRIKELLVKENSMKPTTISDLLYSEYGLNISGKTEIANLSFLSTINIVLSDEKDFGTEEKMKMKILYNLLELI